MKAILMMLLMICLNGCQSITLPKINDHERCSSLIKEIENGVYEGKCRCHIYRVSKDFIGRVSESYDEPLTHCSNKIQFSPTTWSDEYLYFFDEIFFMHTNSKTEPRQK